MNSILQSQAIVNLLDLCDQEIPFQRSKHNNSQHRKLSGHLRPVKCNSVTTNYKGNLTSKVKTEADLGVDRTTNSTQNKQNLKKILQKLNDSPNNQSKTVFQKTKYRQTFHIKSITTQSQSQSKQFKRTPDAIERSLHKIIRIVKEKDLIKTLIKDQTLQNTKKKSLVKMQKALKSDNYKISALRQMQGLKRSQMKFNNVKKQGQSISIYNLLKHEHNLNTLTNGQIMQVNLKNLIF